MAMACHSAATLMHGMSFMSEMAEGLVPCKLEENEIDQRIQDMG